MLREVNRPLPQFTPPVVAPRRMGTSSTGQGHRIVARKYRKAQLKKIQRREYLKLRAIVPSVAAQERVSKVTVIEEAIKYIDELHQALSDRLQGTPSETSSGSESYSRDVSPCPQTPPSPGMTCFPDSPSTPVSHILAPCSPSDQSPFFSLLTRLS